MTKTCIIVNCVSGSPEDRHIRKSLNIKQTSLFSIPKDPTLLAQWQSALKMNLSLNSFICDFHFKNDDIVKSVRYDFPDGSFQIIPRVRWTLLPNAIPINSEPRKYENNNNKNSTIELQKPLEQLDNRHCIKRKPLLENAPGLLTKKGKIENADKHLDSFLQEKSIDDLSKQQSGVQHTLPNNEETNMDAKQVSSSTIDSDKSLLTCKDIQSFINVPPTWYYICYEHEMIFVHVDSLKFTEKLRVFINEDMSVLVSFYHQTKIDLNLKITRWYELSQLFKDLEQESICKGTGINDSASARCCGVILNSRQQHRSPRCTACRILRHQLLNKATKRSHAANKKCSSQKQLRSFKNKCKRLQKKNNNLNAIIKRTISSCAQISDANFMKRIESLDGPQQLLVTTCFEMAKKVNAKSRRYSLEWIYECLLMRFKSGGLYDLLRKRNILPLPSKSTLDKYIKNLNSSAYGFQPALFECLKKRSENMPLSDRRGELVVDEMQLSSGISFNTNTKDFIGMVNLGGHTPHELKNVAGDHALVFQFVPFRGGKSQALGCFLSRNAVTSEVLQKLILECIILMGNAGFHVDAVTSDGAQCNRAVWKIFGIDETKISCPHPYDQTKRLWMISDFAHLIKCFRNHLMQNNFFLTPFGIVKKCHWQAVLDCENYKGANLKIAYKLTPTHLNPVGYQKMRVSLAYELFSDRVAIAMEMLHDGNEALKDYEPTYKFIMLVHNLIKAMTSRDKTNSPHYDRSCKNRKAITDFLNFLEDWEYGMEFLKFPMPFSVSTITGLKVTLASALEITDMMNNECGFEYFMTSRLTQDYLEQLFSIMRYSCGSNEHPDPKLFLQVFRLFCCSSLIEPPKGSNVTGVELLQTFIENKHSITSSKGTQEDWIQKLDESIENCSFLEGESLSDRNIKNAIFKTPKENEDGLLDHDYNVSYTNESIIAYLAGYVSRRMKKKYTFCSLCLESLSSSDSREENAQNQIIDKLSLYNGLSYPSTSLFNLTKKLENIVLDVVGKGGIEMDTIQKVFEKINQTQLHTVGCTTHYQGLTRDIIINYITMRGHFLANTFNKKNEEKKNKSKLYKKLSKL